METMDFSQFSGINSIFSLLAMTLVYFSTELIKWVKKKKTSNAAKDDLRKSLKRLELLNMMQHSPHEKGIITQLYAEYKTLGGNSYIDEQYHKWIREN